MTPSATNLTTPYRPVAIYCEEGDYVEYVRRDILCINVRVDTFLTLIYSLRDRDELIGFRMMGFKNAFLKGNRKSKLGSDFVSAVQVIERALTDFGDQAFDRQRRQAYNQAVRMAVEDGVELRDLPRVAGGRR